MPPDEEDEEEDPRMTLSKKKTLGRVVNRERRNAGRKGELVPRDPYQRPIWDSVRTVNLRDEDGDATRTDATSRWHITVPQLVVLYIVTP